jgi:hemerythrin-like domain-containing protein
VCEYCGCQALESISALTREHEQVLALSRDVRDARLTGDVARQAELACRITGILRPHTLVEERGLFPALAPDFPGQIAQLEAEHRLIEAPLAEAARAAGDGAIPADPTWPGRLAEALDLLREHIFKEQDGVFPAALATLAITDWEKMEAARLAAAALPAVPAP